MTSDEPIRFLIVRAESPCRVRDLHCWVDLAPGEICTAHRVRFDDDQQLRELQHATGVTTVIEVRVLGTDILHLREVVLTPTLGLLLILSPPVDEDEDDDEELQASSHFLRGEPTPSGPIAFFGGESGDLPVHPKVSVQLGAP